MADRLGPDWTPRVWENLGWHWEVLDESRVWHVRLEPDGSYWAYVSEPHDPAVEAHGYGETPDAAMRVVVRAIKTKVQRGQIMLAHASEALDKVADRRLLPI